MPNGKYHEFLDHLFTNILKQPMMSEYCYRIDEYERCDATHIGKCRRVCHKCGTAKLVMTYPNSDLIGIFRSESTFRSAYRIKSKELYQILKKGLSTKLPPDEPPKIKLLVNPMCNSCEYATEWRRTNWRRYVERAINGRYNERRELREIFYEREIRLTIRRLLAFFDCIVLTPLRDGLVGVIDYSYDQ